jgi:hypothetical protein
MVLEIVLEGLQPDLASLLKIRELPLSFENVSEVSHKIEIARNISRKGPDCIYSIALGTPTF